MTIVKDEPQPSRASPAQNHNVSGLVHAESTSVRDQPSKKDICLILSVFTSIRSRGGMNHGTVLWRLSIGREADLRQFEHQLWRFRATVASGSGQAPCCIRERPDSVKSNLRGGISFFTDGQNGPPGRSRPIELCADRLGTSKVWSERGMGRVRLQRCVTTQNTHIHDSTGVP